MMSLAGVTLLIFMGIAYTTFQDRIDTVRREKVMDFGRSVQEEIILASEVHPGYERTMNVPDQIDNIQYDIYLQDDYLIINLTRGGEIPFPLPDTQGSISKGKVTIRNVDGNVQVS